MTEAFIVICVYITWAFLHEMSHVLVAKWVVGITDYSIVLYPHKHDGKWYWARSSYVFSQEPTVEQRACVFFAPRLLSSVACLAFVFGSIIGNWWYIFWLGGVVDHFIGSLGIGGHSDLYRTAMYAGTTRGYLRVLLLSVLFTSCVLAFMLHRLVWWVS